MHRRTALKHTAFLIGYAVSAGALSELFVSCTASRSGKRWKPVFLNKTQAATVSEIAETILPRTNTPGAVDIGVPAFIDRMLKELLSPEEQRDFMSGLAKFEADCRAAYGKAFVECSRTEREEYLLKLDKASGKYGHSFWGIGLAGPSNNDLFYRNLKSLTLLGYYTSQQAGHDIFRYDPIPGVFQGCIPLSDQEHSWNEGA